MEMKLEEAQVCRLCGQCESIYIDVFGEEGTKRFLGLKIHTKINIVIDETDPLPKAICVQCLGKLEFVCDFQEECLRTQEVLRDRYNLPPLSDVINEGDGLSHKVCMRCIGTLEFIDDFHRNCHRTQQQFVESKKFEKCPKMEQSQSPPKVDENDDGESDKENSTPKNLPPPKRKSRATNSPKIRSSTIVPLGPNNDANILTTTRTRIDKNSNKTVEKNPPESTMTTGKSTPTVIVKSKCDSSMKIANPTKTESPLSRQVNSSERKPRRRSSLRNILPPKNDKTETNEISNQPKSKPVPVIVKLEKSENVKTNETTMKNPSNDGTKMDHRWTKMGKILPPADSPKSVITEKPHDQCPTAGDVAEKIIEKTPEMSSTSVNTSTLPNPEIQRKTVIEMTSRDVKTFEKSNQTVKQTRSSSSSSKRKFYDDDDDDDNDDDEDDEDPNENSARRRKIGRISDLITDEQKLEIEKFYTVDMSVVDEQIVGSKISFLDKKRWGCKICNASYSRQDKCQVHLWGHFGMRPYKCVACEFTTVTVSNMRCHIRKSHLKIKPYVCDLCEKRYVTAFLLEEHMNTHTGSRPYGCEICNFTSASRQVLSYHAATHKAVKDIVCDVCGKQFYSKARMRAHVVIHDKDKAANMCKLCSIYLCNSEALKRHYTNVHSQDYVCESCGKRCKSKKALNNHQNVHSAAKYKCEICSNFYKSSHILKEHLLKHKGIRMYKCEVCKKDFAQQSHLAAHMAVHSERRFFCPGCKRPFNRHDNMKIHAKRCETFLAKPELHGLLKIRRARNKNNEIVPKIVNQDSKAPESVESVQQSERPSTDGLFLKPNVSVNVDSNLNITSAETS